jgi:hypothetical protein
MSHRLNQFYGTRSAWYRQVVVPNLPEGSAHLRFFRRPARVAGARTEMLALQKNLRCAPEGIGYKSKVDIANL